MITKIHKRVKNKKGVKNTNARVGLGGTRAFSLIIGGVPAKRAEAEARAGKNSFPPTLFLFARPSDFFSEVSVGIFSEKSSDFVQETQPICKVFVSRLARGFAPRFGGQIFKQFPNEPILSRPKGESKATIFCLKAITNKM